MATNHTTNYNLNLWEPQDDFLRSEFNENTRKIDAALACKFGTDKMPWIMGTYTGNAGDVSGEQHIVLGFRPTILLVIGDSFFGMGLTRQGVSQSFGSRSSDTSTGARSFNCDMLEMTDDGFTVRRIAAHHNASMNNRGTQYFYLAIR